MTLQHPIEGFTCHLTCEHEANFDLTIRPYQRGIHNTKSLRHKGQPGAEVGDAVRGVLAGSAPSTAGAGAGNKHNGHASVIATQAEGSPFCSRSVANKSESRGSEEIRGLGDDAR